MMNKSLILYLFFFTLGYNLNSQECIIKLNLNLCPNCYASYSIIDSISAKFPTKIVLTNISKKKAQYELKKKIPTLHGTYDLIISDSIYQEYSTCFDSEIYIISKNGKKLFNTSISNLQNHFNNNFTYFNKKNPPNRYFSFSDTFFLSNLTKVNIIDEYIYLTDPSYKKIHFTKINDDSIQSLIADSLDHKPLYESCFKDTMKYHLFSSYRDALKMLNKNTLSIHTASVSGDTLYALISLVDPVKKGKTLDLLDQFLLIAFHEGKIINTIPIDDTGLKTYYHLEDFFINNGTYYFKVANDKERDGERKFLAKYHLEGQQLLFNDIISMEVPDPFIEEKIYPNYLSILPSYPYCFFGITTYFCNLQKKEVHRLPFKQNRLIYNEKDFELKSDFYLTSIYHEGDIVAVITADKKFKEFTYSIINIDSGTFIQTPTEIEINNKQDYLSFKLIDLDKLLILTDNSILLENLTLFGNE